MIIIWLISNMPESSWRKRRKEVAGQEIFGNLTDRLVYQRTSSNRRMQSTARRTEMAKSVTMWVAMAVLMAGVTGCYEVEYTVEYKGDSCIKFEDALYYDADLDEWVDACLGDDEVEQTDTFGAVVDSAVGQISVSLKAGGGKNGGTVSDVPVPTVGTATAVGNFVVSATEDTEDGDEEVFTYVILVTSDSDNSTPALSNITFCFGDATVLLPEEGSITTNRDTELTAPGEPEEVDED